MKLIRNLKLIQELISEENLNRLHQAAYLYAKQEQLFFKIHKIEETSWIVGARQYKTRDDRYFNQKEIIDRTRSLFGGLIEGKNLHVHPNPYGYPVVDVVTPHWLQNKLDQFQISNAQIHQISGIDKTDLSRWISGKRPMTQVVKTMFYYLVQSLESLPDK